MPSYLRNGHKQRRDDINDVFVEYPENKTQQMDPLFYLWLVDRETGLLLRIRTDIRDMKHVKSKEKHEYNLQDENAKLGQ